ncbi:MAG: DEAD/DEAH box helicase [Bdellovibrionales bacterium]|nr:DEAD/DEAH box helicase [Bdellovibrionales bacterium]
MQYVDCTPVQEAAIPPILVGKDIAGLAQTGTGKTAAFLVPLIDRVLKSLDHNNSINVEPIETKSVEADSSNVSGESQKTSVFFEQWRSRQFILILVPTRELAEQVYENSKNLLEGTPLKSVAVYGGTTYEKQKEAFQKGVEFVIATPGRLLDLFKEHIVDLKQVRAVVFDEADRMFDMGFKDDMRFILRRIPRERQFLVFSATLNFEVLNVAYEFGAFPLELNLSKDQPKAENVTDELLHLGQEDKPKFLISLLKKHQPKQAIIFSNFKYSVEKLTRFLSDNGIPAVGISSLLTQAQRKRVMEQFKAKSEQNILVATDLAARGLDILGVDMVINYELPDDPENYVHRIGRTGRASQKGSALSLVCDRDVDALTRIEEYLGHKVMVAWLDDSEIIKEMKPMGYSDFQASKPSRPSVHQPKSNRKHDFKTKRTDHQNNPNRHRKPQRSSFSQQKEGPFSAKKTHSSRHLDKPQTAQGKSAQRDGTKETFAQSHHKNSSSFKNFSATTKHSRPNKPYFSTSHSKLNGKSSGSRSVPSQKPKTTGKEVGLGQKVSRFFKNLFTKKNV